MRVTTANAIPVRVSETITSTALSYGVAGDPVWAPDSSRIAYLSSDDDPPIPRFWTAPAGGGSAPVEISLVGGHVPLIPPDGLRWSPDGSRIAYVADQDTSALLELWTVSPLGATNTAQDAARPVSWSVDGSRIIYAARQRSVDLLELFASDPAGPAGPLGNVRISADFPTSQGAVTFFRIVR